MILADENIDDVIIEALRNAGLTVFSVKEKMRGADDRTIAAYSLNTPLIILTEDKDFGELVFAKSVKATGIIFLRYHFSETSLMLSILLNFILENMNELAGKFITITPRKIRIRTLI